MKLMITVKMKWNLIFGMRDIRIKQSCPIEWAAFACSIRVVLDQGIGKIPD